MKTTTHLGIWMDHASAHIMELVAGSIVTRIIASNELDITADKGEKKMHNKEIREELLYYKEISDVIANYDDVLLFGPTDAKTALFNLLRADHHFDKIVMDVKQTDQLTENQEHAYVLNYFANR